MDCFNVSWLNVVVVVVACCSFLILFCFDLLFQLIELTRGCIEEYLLRTFFKMAKIIVLKNVQFGYKINEKGISSSLPRVFC